jgi:glutamate synthase (NADPH/NADH) large chain
VLLDRQQAFGYTQEDLKFLLTPMALTGQEAIGSMGTDTPSRCSRRAQAAVDLLQAAFAQVTNPPIDPIREELVMSLVSLIGPRPNLLDLTGRPGALAPGGQPAGADQRRPGEASAHIEDIRTAPSAP